MLRFYFVSTKISPLLQFRDRSIYIQHSKLAFPIFILLIVLLCLVTVVIHIGSLYHKYFGNIYLKISIGLIATTVGQFRSLMHYSQNLQDLPQTFTTDRMREKLIVTLFSTWPLYRVLDNCPTWRTNSCQCIYLFIVLSIVQKAAWAPGLVCKSAEKLAPLGFDPWTVQPVVVRYTDYHDLVILLYLIITVLQAPLQIHKLMSTPLLLVLTLKKIKLKLSMHKLGVTNA